MSDRAQQRIAPPGQDRMAGPRDAVDRVAAPTGRSATLPGVVAGVVAGVVMAAYLVLAAVLQELEPFTALTPMGATFRGADAAAGGAGALLFGVSLHLAVSALFGLIFALALPRDFTPGSSAFLGIGFAFVVMGFMTSLVVPPVNPVLEDSFHDLGGSWVIAHALFGLTTGYTVQRLRRAVPAGAPRSSGGRSARNRRHSTRS